MKQSNSRAVISGTVCLLIICFVVTLTVSGTRAAFKDKIAEQEWLKQQESMSRIIKADTYEELPVEEGEQAYLALDESGKTLGYIFVTEAYGYGSMISVMSGISEEQVVGVEILDCSSETPGLGQNVAEPSFSKQFKGVTEPPIVTKTAARSKNEIEAVTGATKSSTAVADAVSEAMNLYRTYIDSVE
ncbi:FMN-binding protein [Candidatus Enterococcus clewellii]|uniref:Ion-translocating oxidoreductase complex subunit G n=1 Tax=Candidatus Enterococcus clewellii TaxID=1834193 RepID=A0A242KCM8_9ENTE|nr:FMN-binding protein [Enterococcus sp. 9E7_DIV0242]OTP18925.1 hypothetical protein A5888_000739 [Enterococcus sp. 9E7_DIV0242]